MIILKEKILLKDSKQGQKNSKNGEEEEGK